MRHFLAAALLISLAASPAWAQDGELDTRNAEGLQVTDDPLGWFLSDAKASRETQAAKATGAIDQATRPFDSHERTTEGWDDVEREEVEVDESDWTGAVPGELHPWLKWGAIGLVALLILSLIGPRRPGRPRDPR